MSTSDDLKEQNDLLYKPAQFSQDIVVESYLSTHPMTYLSVTEPTSDWDRSDTIGLGVVFLNGAFVQNTITKVLYRCFDDTPGNATWKIIPQEPK